MIVRQILVIRVFFFDTLCFVSFDAKTGIAGRYRAFDLACFLTATVFFAAAPGFFVIRAATRL
jgi:hypothetical protein